MVDHVGGGGENRRTTKERLTEKFDSLETPSILQFRKLHGGLNRYWTTIIDLIDIELL